MNKPIDTTSLTATIVSEPIPGSRKVYASGCAHPDLRVPFREVLEAALAGHIEDVLTVAMLLRGYHMAREGQLPDALARSMLGSAMLGSAGPRAGG